MSWLSDAHTEWHTVNGWDRVCPLDCGAGEVWDDYEEDDAPASEDSMSDVEADADALAGAGYGTDEDYGSFWDDVPF